MPRKVLTVQCGVGGWAGKAQVSGGGHLAAALHPDVVGLGRDDDAQLGLIRPLAAIYCVDGQHQRVVITDDQLLSIPACHTPQASQLQAAPSTP